MYWYICIHTRAYDVQELHACIWETFGDRRCSCREASQSTRGKTCTAADSVWADNSIHALSKGHHINSHGGSPKPAQHDNVGEINDSRVSNYVFGATVLLLSCGRSCHERTTLELLLGHMKRLVLPSHSVYRKIPWKCCNHCLPIFHYPQSSVISGSSKSRHRKNRLCWRRAAAISLVNSMDIPGKGGGSLRNLRASYAKQPTKAGGKQRRPPLLHPRCPREKPWRYGITISAG